MSHMPGMVSKGRTSRIQNTCGIRHPQLVGNPLTIEGHSKPGTH